MEESNENLRLLEKGDDEHLRAPVEKKGMFISKRMAVSIGLFWIASLGYVARTKTDILELANTNTVTADTPSMFKRTHLSINAIKEGIWLKRTFGFGDSMDEYWNLGSGMNSLDFYFGHDNNSLWEEEAMQGHNHDELEICASRSIFTWNDIGLSNIYNWHEFQASQTPSGEEGPDYWWDVIYKLNTETTTSTSTASDAAADSATDAWSVFLHKGTHFYLKDLSAHMDVFVSNNVPHLTRRYSNVIDGKTMYVAFVPNPYNGNTMILHAKDVSKTEHKAKFIEVEETQACTFALALPYSRSDLDDWLDNTYVHSSNLEDLPKPMPVMDSQPTYDMDEVVSYFDKLGMQGLDATTTLHQVSDSCKVYSISLATQFQTPYEARFVFTPKAKGFETVGALNAYIDTEVRKTTGFNEGYSRWLDEHWAITVRDSMTLDQLRFNLEDSNTPYHAHVTEIIDGSAAGSLWAWGVSGMAIEWHGAFDYTTFHYPIGGFDFCTVDTVCQATDENCLEVVDTSATDDLAGATR